MFTLLSLFAGCSPALGPRREPIQQAFYGEWRGHPENRLVAFGALPPAPILNARINLSGGGGKLLVSNDPEYLTDVGLLPGALYRDELVGSFRVFYHHANSAQVDLTLATAITNKQAAPLLLFMRGSGQGVNLYPDVAGQGAFNGYLRTREQVTLLATLAPGESAFIFPAVVEPGHTVSALEEYVAVTPPRDAAAPTPSLALVRALEVASLAKKAAGASRPKLPAGFSLATVTVTVLAHKGLPPKEPQSLPVLAAGPPKLREGTPYFLLNRGTFPFFDRHAEIPLAHTAAMLTLNSAVSGPFARTIRGEYLPGRDAVNGLRGFNNGNYGVVYHLRFCVSTAAPSGVPYALLMQPAGGVGHYALQAEGDIVTSPFVSHKSGWWFYRALAFGPEACMPLRAHLTGGAFGPQKFFVVPFPLFER